VWICAIPSLGANGVVTRLGLVWYINLLTLKGGNDIAFGVFPKGWTARNLDMNRELCGKNRRAREMRYGNWHMAIGI